MRRHCPYKLLILFACVFSVLAQQAYAAPAVVIWQDGITYGETFIIPANTEWQAAAGARPILTRSNGYPPDVQLMDGATARGLWFGGTRGLANFWTGDDSTLDGNVIWGYFQAVNAGSHNRVTITNNRFVRNGRDPFDHPIYISNPHTAGNGVVIEDNLFVANEGYSIHLWNDALGGTHFNSVRRNFIGGASFGIAARGDENKIRDNVIWSTTDLHLFSFDNDNGSFNHNFIGSETIPALLMENDGTVINNNWFVQPAPLYGANPHKVKRIDVVNYLGVPAYQLDDTIESLDAAFSQSAIAIHANTQIETWFAILDTARENWVAQ